MENKCCSQARKHISDIMEKFHLCTHIPIKAIDMNNIIIHTEGYTYITESIFEEHKIIDKIDNELNKKDSTSCLVLSKNYIDFTVIYICPKNIDRGVYVMGPYTSSPLAKNDMLYKPCNCIPHLITLLRNIAVNTDFIRRKKELPYSLHVKKALDYIDTRFYEPLTVEWVSQKLGINKSYFCSVFKKDTDKTFTQTLNEIRIEKSKQLLRNTDQPILDISIAVGYNNQNYYNMLFKKLNNISPNQYRNEKMNRL
ncbi:helix-turn-helix transcriptional regulator [Natronincola ferrireducens]|uniref:AraC-type DNA-binding protein n=1 Tax=Natronincola ferrireducens TaxID=393762 RepID=A0A1G9GIU5_9FIRM|nr:AraC family transcriptional regulator [Natronincola ferrireducens]SDL00609.1 AraC-type DNA-binding protein [Natronincola ferrireducens]